MHRYPTDLDLLAHAVVLSTDEDRQMRMLDRRHDPALPMKKAAPGP